MAIDGCQLKFIALATDQFPIYLQKLQEAAQSPILMAEFCASDREVTAVRKRLFPKGVTAGCYVLLEGKAPIYVGISKNLFSRLRQHVMGNTHYDASLAYRMAKRRHKFEGTRDDAMRDPNFHRAFEERRNYLRGLNCAFVPIGNPLELYLFEAFCAMELDTFEWNSFVTH